MDAFYSDKLILRFNKKGQASNFVEGNKKPTIAVI